MNVDPKAIEQMKNLAMAFDDIDNGVRPQKQTNLETGDNLYESQKAMENILSKLSTIEGFEYDKHDYTDLKPNADFHQNTKTVDQFDVDQRLANVYANPGLYQDTYIEGEAPQDYIPEPQYVYESAPVAQANVLQVKTPKTPWSIISEEVKGLKNVKKYSIQNSYNNQTIIEGIMMQEAAMALLNVLNEGGTLTNPKVLGIISYGIQYTSILEQAIKSLKDRQAVLRESNYSRAAELDTQISEQKKKAQVLKEQISTFISANGFNPK